MFGSKRSRDTFKYCHFHEDYGHDTNDCRHLKVQIQEAINSGQLSHLVKGIKKEKAKSTDTLRGEGKKDKSIASVEAPILMISREDYAPILMINMAYKEEITFPPVTRVSIAPIIIEAANIHVEYRDRGSSNNSPGAIKFPQKGVGNVTSRLAKTGKNETTEARRTLTISKKRIPSCDDPEEKIIVNDKYPEQMVTIRKQLPEHFKKEL
ncbi:hypothetical protein Tco_0776205 [Tanacetum coccineum]